MAPKPTTEGLIPFSPPNAGKPCFTSYEIFGTPDPASSSTPLVTLHGRPGLCQCLYPLATLNLLRNVPIILYDQIGNGKSTHLPEKMGDETFYNEELVISESINLIEFFGLDKTGYNLLGHSWGGMMSAIFASRRPKGLRKLVISNSPSSVEEWTKGCCAMRDSTPEDMRELLKGPNEEGPEYEEAMMKFFANHMCTCVPLPEGVAIEASLVTDPTANITMNGKSDFVAGGSLRNWSLVEICSNINVPTLIINGTNEGATDEAVKPFVGRIPDVKWVKLKESTHMRCLRRRRITSKF